MEDATARDSVEPYRDILDVIGRFEWSKDKIAIYPMCHINGRDRRQNDKNAETAYYNSLHDGLKLVIMYDESIVTRRGLCLDDMPDHDERLIHAVPHSPSPLRWAHGVVVVGKNSTKVMKNWYRYDPAGGLSDYKLKVAVLEILKEERVLSSWQENL